MFRSFLFCPGYDVKRSLLNHKRINCVDRTGTARNKKEIEENEFN